jgi:molecular chaperone GrpE
MSDRKPPEHTEAAAAREPVDHDETEAERDEREASERVERDLDELQHQRRPPTAPPDLVRERDEYLELAQRTRADFENYRKRVAKETSDALARGKAALARELLPTLDNLERALESASADAEALSKGVSLVLGELREKLGRAGVEAFDPTGERFDPALHEALSTQAKEGAEAGVVIETVEKGYRLNGQVLRPARVVVSE